MCRIPRWSDPSLTNRIASPDRTVGYVSVRHDADDGAPVVTRSVSLASGERTTVEFEYESAAVRTYDLSVGGVDAGTLEIVERDETTMPPETSSGSGTVVGPALAVIALLAAGLLANRRRLDR